MNRTISEKLQFAMDGLQKCEERSLPGQFALEVMHEVRGPLDALGHLVHLAASSTDLAEIHEFMRLAIEQIANLQQIAGQSLTLARDTQNSTAIDLRALAEAALRIHHRRVTSSRIHLVRDFAESTRVTVRAGEILQVISNLVGNAIDALPEEGTITLRIRKRGNRLCLLVADNGPGIPAAHLSRLFQPYFTTKRERGNGLGLTLSKKIIDGHGGRIRVRSCDDPPRCGTIFRITLPV